MLIYNYYKDKRRKGSVLFWIEYCVYELMLLSWRELLVLKFLFLVIKLLVHIVLQIWLLFILHRKRHGLCWEANFSVLNYFNFAFKPYFILLFLLQTYISLHVWCSIPISSKTENSCAGKSKSIEIHFSISFNDWNCTND